MKLSIVGGNARVIKEVNIKKLADLNNYVKSSSESQSQLLTKKSNKIHGSLAAVSFSLFNVDENHVQKRNKKNCKEVHAIYIDIDNKVPDTSPENIILANDVLLQLQNRDLNFFMVESISSTPDVHKLHIIVPFDSPLVITPETQQYFSDVYVKVKEILFDGFPKSKLVNDKRIVDPAVNDISRIMYVSGHDADSWYNDKGMNIDAVNLLEEVKKDHIAKLSSDQSKDDSAPIDGQELPILFQEGEKSTKTVMFYNFDGINSQPAKPAIEKLSALLDLCQIQDQGDYIRSGLFNSSNVPSTVTYLDSGKTTVFSTSSCIEFGIKKKFAGKNLSIVLAQIMDSYPDKLAEKGVHDFADLLKMIFPDKADSFANEFKKNKLKRYNYELQLGYYRFMLSQETISKTLRINYYIKLFDLLMAKGLIKIVRAGFQDPKTKSLNNDFSFLIKENHSLNALCPDKMIEIIEKWVENPIVANIKDELFRSITNLPRLSRLPYTWLYDIVQYIKLPNDFLRLERSMSGFDVTKVSAPREEDYIITHDFSDYVIEEDLQKIKAAIPTLKTLKQGDEITFLKFVGSLLVNYFTQKMFFFAIGAPDSGKTTLFTNLNSLINVTTINSLEDLVSGNSMGKVLNKRLVIVSEEDPKNPSLNNPKVKNLTDHFIEIREKYRPATNEIRSWDYAITANLADFKLNLDPGMKTRLVLVNFEKGLPEVGIPLTQGFFSYSPEMLASMMLYGLQVLADDNFVIQASDVKEAKIEQEFFDSQDLPTQFFKIYFEIDNDALLGKKKKPDFSFDDLIDFFKISEFYDSWYTAKSNRALKSKLKRTLKSCFGNKVIKESNYFVRKVYLKFKDRNDEDKFFKMINSDIQADTGSDFKR